MHLRPFPADIHLFKFSIKNTIKKCGVCTKLTAEAPERRHWVFIVDIGHVAVSWVDGGFLV